MSLLDTHTRLADPRYSPAELPEIAERARQAGVAGALVVGTSLEASRRAIQIAERLAPEWDAWAAVGVQPAAAASVNEETITALHRMGQARRVRAIAAGLDFAPAAPARRVQLETLEALLQLSQWLDLPLALHEGAQPESPGRLNPLVECLSANREVWSSGWVHDFDSSRAALEAYLSLGLSIGVSGRITDRSAGARIRELLPDIPPDCLLLETDAPAHPPKPHHRRTDRSEPAFLADVLKEVAHLRHESAGPLGETVSRNARRLLRLDDA